MADEAKQDKKIIVDEDWKADAKKEKATLEAEKKAEKEAPEAEGQQQHRQQLPEGNFAALLSMLMIQTVAAMGMPLEQGQEPREPDLELARYHIDMLQTLEEKTKGNLTEQEKAVLSQTLSDLRMSFVRLSEQGGQKAQQ